MRRTLRLVVASAVGGGLTGVVSFAFLRSLDWATRTRISSAWLVWLLPAVGLVVGVTYHYLGGRAKGGTPAVIEQGHLFTHGVPARMTPLIFGGSIVGHLAGASVGREGAALQIAGSVTDTTARIARFSSEDRRTLIAASLAGGWGAVYAVPITGVVFTMQVTRRHALRALLPAIASAVAGNLTVRALGYKFTGRPHISAPDWTIGLPAKLVVFGIACGLFARCFVSLIQRMRTLLADLLRWPPARPLLGGFATLGAMALFGRDYLGMSSGLLGSAVAGDHINWYVPLLKLLFTVIALGSGFVGGEVLPLFVIGGTLGGAIAPGLHAPAPLLAAVGSAITFSSAASVMLTGVVLTVEQFGWNTLLPALVVAVVARVAAGKPGLYIANQRDHARST